MVPVRARRALATATTLLLVATLGGCALHQRKPGYTGKNWTPAAAEVAGLRAVAQSDASGFRLHTASGDKTFLPGVNLGSTTPGHQPGEVGTIAATVYRTWFSQMDALGIRVVRAYTLHPPAFYTELARWNEAHARSPIYLFQGAYLPDEDYILPGRTLYDAPIDSAFTQELTDLSGAVHGDLTREQRPGRAGGTYTADVSRWVAGWIIGVEWDNQGVTQTDTNYRAAAYTPGRYFAATPDATPTERWITDKMDHLATLEAAHGISVPIAAANWPPADPLHHPTEPFAFQDAVSVDANHMLPTRAWPGGTFASFHAYPNYPDFMKDEPGLDQTTWEGEADRYAGYVVSLRKHYETRMPLLITEFGVPSSLGLAHYGTNGRDQGGHSEQQAMSMDASMMRMIHAVGASGAFVFSWEDEWFKHSWNTDLHQDAGRRQLWHDPLTNEEWYGLVATDTPRAVDAAVEVRPTSGPWKYLYVWGDYSYVHIEATARAAVPEQVQVDADVLPGNEKADYRVLLDRAEGTGTALVRRALDPMRMDTDEHPYRPDEAAPWHVFTLYARRAHNGQPAQYDPVGNLRQGSWDPRAKTYDSMSSWNLDAKHRTVRIRVPWSMLGMADPSNRTALGEGLPATRVQVPGIGLDVLAEGSTDHVSFTWPTWTRVSYATRPKAGVGKLEEAYRALAP